PVVRAAGRRGKADLVPDAADLLGEPQAIAVETMAGAQYDGVCLWLRPVDLGRALFTELTDQVGAQQLPLPVGREAEGEELAAGEHVGGRRAPDAPGRTRRAP